MSERRNHAKCRVITLRTALICRMSRLRTGRVLPFMLYKNMLLRRNFRYLTVSAYAAFRFARTPLRTILYLLHGLQIMLLDILPAFTPFISAGMPMPCTVTRPFLRINVRMIFFRGAGRNSRTRSRQQYKTEQQPKLFPHFSLFLRSDFQAVIVYPINSTGTPCFCA